MSSGVSRNDLLGGTPSDSMGVSLGNGGSSSLPFRKRPSGDHRRSRGGGASTPTLHGHHQDVQKRARAAPSPHPAMGRVAVEQHDRVSRSLRDERHRPPVDPEPMICRLRSSTPWAPSGSARGAYDSTASPTSTPRP